MRPNAITLMTLLAWAIPGRSAMAQENWPQLFGPQQNSHADGQVALRWSETQNIRWKTAIPGTGWSSPVIWGEQIWMTTATGEGASRRAVCMNKNTGRIVYDIELFRPQRIEAKNAVNSYASPTPVIEEGRVYISFGTVGQACLDTASGKTIWTNLELKIDHLEGPGSSPILYRNLFILNCDGSDVQYVVALDKQTGKIVWKTPRTYPFNRLDGSYRKAFTVPSIVQIDGRDQLISVGAWRIYGYDPLSGRELWFADMNGYSTAIRPQYADGVVYVATGYDESELIAVDIAGAAGAVPRSKVVWNLTANIPSKPTPLLVGDAIYIVNDSGIAQCLDRKTGRQIWQKRIGDNYSTAPLLAGGNVYFFSEGGKTVVMKPGDTPEILAENELEDGFMASPAVSGKAMYLRTRTSLYRVEER